MRLFQGSEDGCSHHQVQNHQKKDGCHRLPFHHCGHHLQHFNWSVNPHKYRRCPEIIYYNAKRPREEGKKREKNNFENLGFFLTSLSSRGVSVIGFVEKERRGLVLWVADLGSNKSGAATVKGNEKKREWFFFSHFFPHQDSALLLRSNAFCC